MIVTASLNYSGRHVSHLQSFTFRELADTLKRKLSDWLSQDPSKAEWKRDFSRVIEEEGVAIDTIENSLPAYLTKGREIDFKDTQTCNRTIRWCTIGDLDTSKCKWVARAMAALGIEPSITCVKTNSVFECLRKISVEQQADIITIDSNYGYVARK